MKVFLTGVPGTESKAGLKELVAFAKSRGKEVHTRTVSDYAFKFAQTVGYEIVDESVVLDTLPALHDLMRGGAYKDIISDLDKDNIIIDAHASLYRNGAVDLLRDDNFITAIDPDFFVTVIDAPEVIVKRLKTKKHPLWRESGIRLDDVVNWQNQEVNYTAIWAMAKKKPHYIISRAQLVEMLYKLIYQPKMEVVYVSYAMTNADPELVKRRNRFIEELKHYFNVIDPKSIEVGLDQPNDEEREKVFYHTVYRDLRWWVGEAKKVIAFHPKRIYSSGMNSEMLWAKMHTKTVWLISPEESPFTSYFVAHRVFKDEKTFFAHLKKSGYKRIKR